MNKSQLLKSGAINALGATIYIVIISSFLFYANHLFGPTDNVLMPITMLLLLVLSAALMGLLIFGRPVIMYLNGSKKEAVHLLAYTIGSLAVITVLALVILIAVSHR